MDDTGSGPGPDLAMLASQFRPADVPVPDAVRRLAAQFGCGPEPAWRNELGGLTFRLGDRFVKWNPRGNGLDLDRERGRLAWLAGRHPVATVLDHGADAEAQWLVLSALAGETAVSERWRARPATAIRAIAAGLRALHAVTIDDVPAAWAAESWVGRAPAALWPRPPILTPVLVHGDACAPNTLVSDAGDFVGTVDVGALAVGDRWADLAVASLSLGWNYGAGHEQAFFDAYGIEPDAERIAWYRALWHLES